MSWKNAIFTIVLFYIFVLLQNSFFPNFNLLGAIPDLIFIYFFTLAFFSSKEANYSIIFYALIAGFFSDLYSLSYFGPSIILMIIIGLTLKKVQLLLKNKGDNYPFSYFISLFIAFWFIYVSLLGLYFHFFNFNIIFQLIYNTITAVVFFFSYKSFQKSRK